MHNRGHGGRLFRKATRDRNQDAQVIWVLSSVWVNSATVGGSSAASSGTVSGRPLGAGATTGTRLLQAGSRNGHHRPGKRRREMTDWAASFRVVTVAIDRRTG